MHADWLVAEHLKATHQHNLATQSDYKLPTTTSQFGFARPNHEILLNQLRSVGLVLVFLLPIQQKYQEYQHAFQYLLIV